MKAAIVLHLDGTRDQVEGVMRSLLRNREKSKEAGWRTFEHVTEIECLEEHEITRLASQMELVFDGTSVESGDGG